MSESASSSFELDARLHVTAHEQGQTRQFPIGVPTVEGIELVIGRSRSVDLTIHDDYISNKHLKIVFRSGEHWLEDLGSTHGTKVNNEPVKSPRVLKTGDVVSLGRSSFEYRCTRRSLESAGSIAEYIEEPAKEAAAKDEPPAEQPTGVTMAQQATLNATRAAAAAKAADEAKAREGATKGAAPKVPPPEKAAAAEPGEPTQRVGILAAGMAFIAVVGIVALVCYLAWQLFFAARS